MKLDLNSIIVASEMMSVLVAGVILITMVKDNKRNSRNAAFLGCNISLIISLICDIGNYLFEGTDKFLGILYITNYGLIIAGSGIVICFSRYVYECVKEKSETNDFMFKTIVFACAMNLLIQTVWMVMGLNFTITNGMFHSYDLYNLNFIIFGACLLLVKIYLFRNIKSIGKKVYNIFALYYVFPVVTIIFALINTDYSFVLQGVTLSCLIAYIEIEHGEKEKLLNDLINKDKLTGLLNRNAFVEDIKSLHYENVSIEIIWTDLNNLKYANDNFGHSAGDSLIETFSDILKNVFKNDMIYRVGGDEFVIISKDMSTIDDKMKTFKNRIQENKNIACFGREKGLSSSIDEILRIAEERMYQEKNRLHIGRDFKKTKFINLFNPIINYLNKKKKPE